MRDLEYQEQKEARSETNPKNIVSKEYHDFLNVFSKKNTDILSLHQKYDHTIVLKKD